MAKVTQGPQLKCTTGLLYDQGGAVTGLRWTTGRQYGQGEDRIGADDGSIVRPS